MMQALHELGVLDPKVPSVTSTVFVTDTALLVTLAHFQMDSSSDQGCYTYDNLCSM